jgi:hypothetical protein
MITDKQTIQTLSIVRRPTQDMSRKDAKLMTTLRLCVDSFRFEVMTLSDSDAAIRLSNVL